jgi:transcription elongation factor Elf1
MPRKFVFDCPGCDAEVVVDADVRSEILAGGCVMCRSSTDAGSFVPVSEADVERDATR